MEKEIFNELANKISENFNIDRKFITPNKKFRTDLGLDSFDAAELSFIIKECFGAEITQDNSTNLKTVRDTVLFIENNLKNRDRKV